MRGVFPLVSASGQDLAAHRPVSRLSPPRSREDPHMKLTYAKVAAPILALAIALGIGACSRAQHVTGAITGPGRSGPGSQIVSGCPTLIANVPNSAFDCILDQGSVAQFRANRLRIDVIGDATEIQVLSMGSCIASDVPTINITGAHANVFLAGTNHSITTTGQRLTFG